MLRVVIDTNVLVSYLLTRGETISSLMEFWKEQDFTLLASPQIIAELERVLEYPHLRARLQTEEREAFLEAMKKDAELVPGRLELSGVTRDPKDDMFVACAVEGKAKYIVSGDPDVTSLEEYEGIQVVTPREFVEILERQADQTESSE